MAVAARVVALGLGVRTVRLVLQIDPAEHARPCSLAPTLRLVQVILVEHESALDLIAI